MVKAKKLKSKKRKLNTKTASNNGDPAVKNSKSVGAETDKAVVAFTVPVKKVKLGKSKLGIGKLKLQTQGQKSGKAKGNASFEFKVLKWKCQVESSVVHQFFVKAHQNVRESDNPKKPTGKTLLVINIPSFVSEDNLTKLFSSFGPVKEVFLHQNPTAGLPEKDDPFFAQFKNQIFGYKVAYVVFKNPKSVADILELDSDEIEPLVMSEAQYGLAKWIHQYNAQIVPSSVLEDNVKKFMEKFDQDEFRRRKEQENNEGQADDDGWIKVTRSGPRAGTRRTEYTEERLKEKKRKSEKQLLNFSPTQIKETRARQLVELKKKFDEDKQLVSAMKQQRKFKPFT